MKTYLFPEVQGHGEITEWVPADVARELLDAMKRVNNKLDCFGGNPQNVSSVLSISAEAIKKACGEL